MPEWPEATPKPSKQIQLEAQLKKEPLNSLIIFGLQMICILPKMEEGLVN